MYNIPDNNYSRQNYYPETKKKTSFRKMVIVGIIVGVVMAVINTIAFGMPGMIWMPLMIFFMSPSENWGLSICSGEDCWGLGIIIGDYLFLLVTPLVFAFIGYLVNRNNIWFNAKKIILFFTGIFFITVLFVFFIIELTLDMTANRSQLYDFPKFTSESDCEKFSRYEEHAAGICRGYFASQKNDINYCFGRWEKLEKDENPSNFVKSYCVTAFSIYQKNEKNCREIKTDKLDQFQCQRSYQTNELDRTRCSKSSEKGTAEFQDNCLATYYIVSDQREKCDSIQYILANWSCKENLQPYQKFLRLYASVRGKQSKMFSDVIK